MIYFTTAEIDQAKQYGSQRQRTSNSNSRASDSAYSDADGFKLHFIGVLAEMAWARECGVPYDFTNGTYKNGHDVVDRDGVGWEVKGGRTYNYHIYLNEHSDNFAFVHVNISEVRGIGHSYEIMGTLTRERLMTVCKMFGRPEYWRYGALNGKLRGWIVNWEQISGAVDYSRGCRSMPCVAR